MAKTRTVALYGNSLVMSTVGASLAECADLSVVRVDAACADAAERLAALAPVAIIFDRATARPDLAMALLETHPQMMVIGVDAVSEQMLVVSGRPARAVTAADVIGVIRGSSRPGETVDRHLDDGILKGES